MATIATSLAASPQAEAAVGVWSTPVTLSAGPDGYGGGSTGSSPQVAASADGSKVVAVFTRRKVQLDGEYDLLQVSRSTDGGVTWSGGSDVSTWGQYADQPQIASSADGTKLAVLWIGMSNPTLQVKIITSANSGASWSAVTTLSPWGQGTSSPQLKMSSDGSKITVVWAQYDPSIRPISFTVQSKSSTNGGATWPGTATVISAVSAENLSPQLAASADGTRLTAIWRMKSGTSVMIQATSSANSGASWSTSIINVIGAEGIPTAPQITASADGLKVTAISTGIDGGNYRVRTRSSTDGGVTWGSSVYLSAAGLVAELPQITSSADGTRLSAVWQQKNGSFTVIQTSTSTDAGVTWGTVSDLTDTGQTAGSAQIVGSSDGAKLTAVWFRRNINTYYVIQSRASVDFGVTWSAVSEVSNSTNAQNYSPRMTGSSDGSLVAAVWSRGAGSTAYSVIQAAAVSTLAPGLTPAFGSVTRTADGFTVPISNYDAAYGWAVSSSSGAVSISGAVVTVTGLAAGASATVTAITTRSGYASGSAMKAGQALSAQTVTWSPTTAVTIPASPLTPSSPATALGGAIVSYAVTSAGTTGCTVDATTGVLTYSSTGSCTVRASSPATSAYAAGSRDVTFTATLASQTVTWSPTTAVTLPASPLTPTSPATALGGAVLSYEVTSAGMTGCTVDPVTGVLTYSAAGSCTVRASAAATTAYAAGARDVTFSMANAAAGLAWTPVTALVASAGSVVFAAASATSPGTIAYVVSGAGATGCTVDSVTRILTFAAAGSCQVTASVPAASGYDAASSVSTFAITRDVPSLAWAPSSTIYAGDSPITLGAATTNSSGAVTYAVSTDSGAGCTIADASLPVVTVTTSGSCTITAQVAQSDVYAARTQSIVFTVALATPVMTWSPSLALSMPAATITPASATTDSTGAITYTVTSEAGTSCLVSASTGVLSYAGAGQCQVTATVASTPRYSSASVSAIFTVSLAMQSITISSTGTSLAPSGSASLTTSGYSGTGAVTLARSSGVGVCSLSGVTVLAVADGTCVITAAIAADSTYAAASTTIAITVTTPAPSGGGGSGGPTGASIGSTTSSIAVRDRSLDPIVENARLAPGGEMVTVDGRVMPVRVEANSASTGLDVIGPGWLVQVVTHGIDGAPRPLESGGVMAVAAGSKLQISGSGFDGLSQVRIYLMSRSTHLGSLMTDTFGDFTGFVTAPADVTLGPDALQINGFTWDRTVRSVSLGVRVVSGTAATSVSVGSRVYFPYKSAVLTRKAQRSLMAMIAHIPVGQSATAGVIAALRSTDATALDRSLARKRSAAVREFLQSHGISGEVTSRIQRVVVRDRFRDRRVEITVSTSG